MKEYIITLKTEFERHANPIVASGQKAYKKSQFEFYGLTAPERRKIQRTFLLKEYIVPKKDLKKTVKILWSLPQREFQMFGQELVNKYSRYLLKEDIGLLEFMVTHKSWWDTVDFIAVNLIGSYFKLYPALRKKYVKKWLASNNMWLQRSALLFQLKYKHDLDAELLGNSIKSLLGSNEFFINKAIGWVLREYSKTNPDWVKKFVKGHPLHSLSRREALRRIK